MALGAYSPELCRRPRWTLCPEGGIKTKLDKGRVVSTFYIETSRVENARSEKALGKRGKKSEIVSRGEPAWCKITGSTARLRNMLGQ